MLFNLKRITMKELFVILCVILGFVRCTNHSSTTEVTHQAVQDFINDNQDKDYYKKIKETACFSNPNHLPDMAILPDTMINYVISEEYKYDLSKAQYYDIYMQQDKETNNFETYVFTLDKDLNIIAVQLWITYDNGKYDTIYDEIDKDEYKKYVLLSNYVYSKETMPTVIDLP